MHCLSILCRHKLIKLAPYRELKEISKNYSLHELAELVDKAYGVIDYSIPAAARVLSCGNVAKKKRLDDAIIKAMKQRKFVYLFDEQKLQIS